LAPGAQDATEVAPESLGTVASEQVGMLEVPLNAAGIAVVQKWIDQPFANHGLQLSSFLTGDAITVGSSESLLLASRPTLNLSWRLPGAPPRNAPPIVDAGADQTVPLHRGVLLEGTVSDDGNPDPPAAMTVAWTQVSGPAPAVFANASHPDTHVSFNVPGTYEFQLTADDGARVTSDQVTVVVEDLSIPSAVAFQDGVWPTPEYAGTRDTKLRFEKPTTNYKTATALDLDGSPDFAALLKWDISQVPTGSLVVSAQISLNVLAPSVHDFELYQLSRNWTENGATWNEFAAGSAWEVAGATGFADHAEPVAGVLAAPALGERVIELNEAGLAALQSWIDDPTQNFGFILQDYLTASDGATFASRESLTAELRPKLSVSYLRPGAPRPNRAPRVEAGAPQVVALATGAVLDGNVQDDGLPTPEDFSIQWMKVDGSGSVTFANAGAADTAVQFGAAGNYVLRLTASDGVETRSDEVAVRVVDLTQAVHVHFQDGLGPSPAYSGTRDTKLRSERPTSNYGTNVSLDLDGSPPLASLFKWDISSLPASAQVQSVSITLNTVGVSTGTFELYEAKRPWQETSATWNEFATGQSWELPGAQGASDRGATVLGVVNATVLGQTTITLNAAGIALIQSWIADPSKNLGFILQDYSEFDALTFTSRETLAAELRPRLTVSYLTNDPNDVPAGSGTPAALADVVFGELGGQS
jgi:hypothetical protein